MERGEGKGRPENSNCQGAAGSISLKNTMLPHPLHYCREWIRDYCDMPRHGAVPLFIVLGGSDTMHNIISAFKAPYLAGMLLTGLLTELTPILLSLYLNVNLPSWLTFCCKDSGNILI